LMVAVMRGDDAVVQILLAAGALMNLRAKSTWLSSGETAEEMATRLGHLVR
jgi:hypothetical protein